MKAEIVWFSSSGYGFARTADGQNVFVHRQNFLRDQDTDNVFQGTKIECELRPVEDGFTKALNAGELRDQVGKRGRRNPRRAIRTNEKRSNRFPAAIKIRVIEATVSRAGREKDGVS